MFACVATASRPWAPTRRSRARRRRRRAGGARACRRQPSRTRRRCPCTNSSNLTTCIGQILRVIPVGYPRIISMSLRLNQKYFDCLFMASSLLISPPTEWILTKCFLLITEGIELLGYQRYGTVQGPRIGKERINGSILKDNDPFM